MRTVLFTGGGGAGSSALATLLADRYEVHFADAEPDARPHNVTPERWHRIPKATDETFLGGLHALCGRLQVDVLVPGVDEEVAEIAKWPRPRAVLLPSVGFVALHRDKLSSARHMGRHVAGPITEGATRRTFVGFPCIVKPRRGRGSRGVRVVHSQAELDAHLLLTDAECIVQGLLRGDEYTVTVAADRDANLRAVVPARVDLKRGVTIRATTTHDSAVIELCETIHAANPVPGCYNVQCIKGTDGIARPFEINPRVSTTTCLAIAAGIDPIAIYMGDVPGTGLLPFKGGVSLSRSWHNEFTRTPVAA